MAVSSRLHLLWRIFYHSLYYFLSLILLLLLCVTPADAIRQSYLNSQRFHILIIIICLSVTVAAVVCIYFFRLYVTRTVLASIPKPYIPIEKGEVRKSVRKIIVASLSRSAAIAYESRPRVVAPRPVSGSIGNVDGDAKEQDNDKDQEKAGKKNLLRVFGGLKKATTAEDKMGITLPPHKAVWGEIEHYGWASPNCPDLPNLQYSTVISELPNLIEAKALTLAPSAPESEPGQPPIMDPDAIELLQRPDNLALRQYLARLSELDVLPASRTTADFLSVYDHARYSTRPISNARFRELMHLFAEILRAMQPLDPAILEDDPLQAGDGATISTSSESDIDDHAPRESPSTPRSRVSSHHLNRQPSNATTRSSNSNGSQIRRKRTMTMGTTRTFTGTFRTAPTTPHVGDQSSSPTSSVNSFAQTRVPFAPGDGGFYSSSSSAAGSVIRLSDRFGPGELPYVLTLAESHQ